MITKKYYKLIRVSHADSGYFYIKNVSNEVGEFKMNAGNGTMEYSLDGVTWNSYNMSTKPTVNVNPGSNIYLRGTGFSSNGYSSILTFNKDYNVCGNFMSISNYTTMSSVTEINSSNVIKYAFRNQTNLISAADLNFGNVTTISANAGMLSFFEGCSSLTAIPDFSNFITIGYQCFSGCFSNCTSLTTGADFSNITSVGSESFSSCYSGCTHISNVTTPNVQDLTQNVILAVWLNNAGTQATGAKTVNVPTGAAIATGSDSGIPTGWTRVDY